MNQIASKVIGYVANVDFTDMNNPKCLVVLNKKGHKVAYVYRMRAFNVPKILFQRKP